MENSDNLNNSHDITNNNQNSQPNNSTSTDFSMLQTNNPDNRPTDDIYRIPSNYPNDDNNTSTKNKDAEDFAKIPSNYPNSDNNTSTKNKDAEDFAKIPSNYPNDDNNTSTKNKDAEDFAKIPSNYPNDNQNTNIITQQSTNNTQNHTRTDSNDIQLLTSTNKSSINHRPIRRYKPKKRQITETESTDETNESKESNQVSNFLNFPDLESNVFLLDLSDYEKGQNENGFIQFIQNYKFYSSNSIFDESSIIKPSNSTIITRDGLSDSMSQVKRSISVDYRKDIKLSSKTQIYLTHFYEQIPSNFNCQILVSQITSYMVNSNLALAHFQGFSNYDSDGNFVPTVLTERPVNGPLSSLFKNFGSFDAVKKFVLICGIINGLGFIHKNGHIHSNLNPTTVYADENFHSKICDYFYIPPFTITSLKDSKKTVFEFQFDTKLGQTVFQNPLYVAPEILKGEKFDQSSDIFSLGLTIFFILTEKEATLDEEGNITNYPDDFSTSWQDLIDTCISRDARIRMPAKEILEELLNDDQRMHDYIDSITNTKNEISQKSRIYLMFVKKDLKNDYENKMKPDFDIFHSMVPNIFEINQKTRLIISAAENNDDECLMEVADYFMHGKNHIHKDESWAFSIYKQAADRGNFEAKQLVADFYEKGIITNQNLTKAHNLYNEIIKKIDPKDPKYTELTKLIEDIEYRNTNMILTNVPPSYTRNKLIQLFERRKHKIEVFAYQSPPEEEEDDDDDDDDKPIKVRIKFQNNTSMNRAILDIKGKKLKFEGCQTIEYELLRKEPIDQSHRFDSLIPELPRFNLKDFYSGKDKKPLQYLDNGNFANTYKIVEKVTGKILVAKVLKQELTVDQINSLKREIIMASKFNHIAILKYLGFNEHSLAEYYDVNSLGKEMDKKVYNGLYPTIFMEFIPNGTLENAIANKPVWWNETRKLKAIIGIASALAQMFALNITHRDLKPSNILMNEKYEPVICDFGCARQFVSDEHNNMSNKVGTPIYEAPELFIIKFPPKYTYEVDSYAFGIILFQILSGCIINEIYPNDLKINTIYDYKLSDFKRDPPENTHTLFWSLIESCWNVSFNKRPDPPTIYSALIEAINKGENLLPGADMTDVIDYVNRLPDIKLD